MVLDYIVWACGNVLPNYLELRPSLIGIDGDDQRVADAVQRVSEVLMKPATLDAFKERSRQRERVVTPFQIEPLLKNNSIDPQDRVRINSRSACDGANAQYINGRKAEFEGELCRVIESLAVVGDLSVAELRQRLSLDESTVDAIISDLARADVIEIIRAS